MLVVAATRDRSHSEKFVPLFSGSMYNFGDSKWWVARPLSYAGGDLCASGERVIATIDGKWCIITMIDGKWWDPITDSDVPTAGTIDPLDEPAPVDATLGSWSADEGKQADDGHP